MALWDTPLRSHDPDLLRRALYGWIFNSSQRGGSLEDAARPDESASAIAWMLRHSRPLSDLEDPTVLRLALRACATKLDGTSAASSTGARKRSALYSALAYAVELGGSRTIRLTRSPGAGSRTPRWSIVALW